MSEPEEDQRLQAEALRLHTEGLNLQNLAMRVTDRARLLARRDMLWAERDAINARRNALHGRRDTLGDTTNPQSATPSATSSMNNTLRGPVIRSLDVTGSNTGLAIGESIFLNNSSSFGSFGRGGYGDTQAHQSSGYSRPSFSFERRSNNTGGFIRQDYRPPDRAFVQLPRPTRGGRRMGDSHGLTLNSSFTGPTAADSSSTFADIDLLSKTITVADQGDQGKAECVVCYDEVELETTVSMLRCQHWFHEGCIKLWLAKHKTCPICRTTFGT